MEKGAERRPFLFSLKVSALSHDHEAGLPLTLYARYPERIHAIGQAFHIHHQALTRSRAGHDHLPLTVHYIQLPVADHLLDERHLYRSSSGIRRVYLT